MNFQMIQESLFSLIMIRNVQRWLKRIRAGFTVKGSFAAEWHVTIPAEDRGCSPSASFQPSSCHVAGVPPALSPVNRTGGSTAQNFRVPALVPARSHALADEMAGRRVTALFATAGWLTKVFGCKAILFPGTQDIAQRCGIRYHGTGRTAASHLSIERCHSSPGNGFSHQGFFRIAD